MRTFAVRILGSRIMPMLLTLPLNGRPGYAFRVMSRSEHAKSHGSRILNFYANLRGANTRIEDHANVADPTFERATGIRVQGDVRRVAEPHMGHVILVHVANNPHRRDVRNRERARR